MTTIKTEKGELVAVETDSETRARIEKQKAIMHLRVIELQAKAQPILLIKKY